MKCATKDCPNQDHEGQFEGAFCCACTRALRTGIAGNGSAWLHQQADRLLEAERLLTDAQRFVPARQLRPLLTFLRTSTSVITTARNASPEDSENYRAMIIARGRPLPPSAPSRLAAVLQSWNPNTKFLDDEPDGCSGCGAIAGVCSNYPNCPGGSPLAESDSTLKDYSANSPDKDYSAEVDARVARAAEISPCSRAWLEEKREEDRPLNEHRKQKIAEYLEQATPEALAEALANTEAQLLEALRWKHECAPLLSYLTGSDQLCANPVEYAQELYARISLIEQNEAALCRRLDQYIGYQAETQTKLEQATRLLAEQQQSRGRAKG